MGIQRRLDTGVVAGVCAGVAEDVRVGVGPVRAAFVAAGLLGGAGVFAYLLLWIFTPAAPLAPGARRSRLPLVAAGLLLAGGAALYLGSAPALILACAATGTVLLWWRPQARAAVARSTGGVALLVLAALALIAYLFGVTSLTTTVGAATIVLGMAALVAGPFVLRLIRERNQERAEQIAQRQRAEIAAHLHDSVLQTLSLIQREHSDPDAVLRLARAEERGLRAWLYGSSPEPGQARGLADRFQDAAAAVEMSEAALIEVVTVGDTSMDTPATAAVIGAAREAMLNAVRHSGDPGPVQVFARISDDDVAVYVRDRGCGFDPAALPEDRAGVRQSIIGRVARAGGDAVVRSAAGLGTEVQILMPL